MASLRASVLAGMMLLSAAQAGPVGDLVSFSAGTTAKSSEVNGNFTSIATAVNDNDARIAMLEAANADLQTEITDLKAAINNLFAVNQFMEVQTVNGNPAIRQFVSPGQTCRSSMDQAPPLVRPMVPAT